jgi:hypothetical protein
MFLKALEKLNGLYLVLSNGVIFTIIVANSPWKFKDKEFPKKASILLPKA